MFREKVSREKVGKSQQAAAGLVFEGFEIISGAQLVSRTASAHLFNKILYDLESKESESSGVN